MTDTLPTLSGRRRMWRLTTPLVAGLLLAALATSSALAGKPATGPSPNNSYAFAAGEMCTNAVVFENTTLKARDSAFGVSPSGTQRILSRGMGVSRVVDQATGATYHMKGGFGFRVTIAADGSVRVDGHGTDIIAWYYPGDDSELGPGLFDINGYITEWYAPDGTFLKATSRGSATDICAALGD